MTEALPYATPEYHRAKPSTVGFLLGLLGLGLIFLCGCFMIGIMMVQYTPPSQGIAQSQAAPAANILYIAVLYLFAFACFGGGVFVIGCGVKKLIQS